VRRKLSQRDTETELTRRDSTWLCHRFRATRHKIVPNYRLGVNLYYTRTKPWAGPSNYKLQRGGFIHLYCRPVSVWSTCVCSCDFDRNFYCRVL